jgi:hypothetical protein
VNAKRAGIGSLRTSRNTPNVQDHFSSRSRSAADLEGLRAAASWQANLNLPKLSDAEREQVHVYLDELTTEHLARRDVHRDRLRRAGHHLGREVAAHKVTIDEANRRIDQLAERVDTESLVPMPLVPYPEAVDIAGKAFAAGFEGRL